MNHLFVPQQSQYIRPDFMGGMGGIWGGGLTRNLPIVLGRGGPGTYLEDHPS